MTRVGRLLGLTAGLLLYALGVPASHAVLVNEAGDAGETLDTAQDLTGTTMLTSISGELINLGDVFDPIDDVDLYKIRIADPASFSVTVWANLSEDNDAKLFLFDSSGFLVLDDDDSGVDLLPQFDVGVLSGEPPGDYFLAFSLFETTPNSLAARDDALESWDRAPEFFQTGPYTLTLTGTAVPEPATIALLSLGLTAMGFSLRRPR